MIARWVARRGTIAGLALTCAVLLNVLVPGRALAAKTLTVTVTGAGFDVYGDVTVLGDLTLNVGPPWLRNSAVSARSDRSTSEPCMASRNSAAAF